MAPVDENGKEEGRMARERVELEEWDEATIKVEDGLRRGLLVVVMQVL